MMHIYIYDESWNTLQYSHCQEDNKGLCGNIYETDNISEKRPPFKRCWVILTEKLESSGYYDMVNVILWN